MKSAHPIGIMQGRLLPPREGRIQSFPAGRWAEEFPRAAAAGLDSIEWIYDDDPPGVNPLETAEGIDAVRQAAAATGVVVGSICADRFMVRRLVDRRGDIDGAGLEDLRGLIEKTARLGAAHIVLPFVDASALPTPPERAGLEKLLAEVLPDAERSAVELHLETDWAPRELVEFVGRVGHRLLRVNYDIGNSASLGHDPAEELSLLRPYLGSVHIKDRVRGGSTVPLGSGDADFAVCFEGFRQAGYERAFILQVARNPAVNEVIWARRNRCFVEGFLQGLGLRGDGPTQPAPPRSRIASFTGASCWGRPMKIGRERQRAGEDEALTWHEAPALPRPESSGRVFDRRLASSREFGDTNRRIGSRQAWTLAPRRRPT